MSSLGGLLSDAPLPLEDPIAQPKRPGMKEDPLEGHITRSWLDWFTSLTNSVSASSPRIASVELTAQTANIAATDISNGDLSGGLYRLWYYLSITAAGALGTLTLTLDWTENGIAKQVTSTALDETNTAKHTEDALLIRIDAASPVRYSVGGATFGVGYTLAVQLESAH